MAISTVTTCLLLLLYYSYVPPIVAHPAPHPEIPQKTSQHLPYSAELHSFPNDRLYRAYHVIQRFKSTITADPKNTTATWTGHDICGDATYHGFFCLTPTGRAEDLTVAGIIWNGYGLRAPTLQGFIDNLPDLAFFHSASNYFTADVPCLDSLPYLYNLDVDKEDIPVHPSAYVSTDSTIHGGCINGNIKINITLEPHMKRWGWGMIPAGATNARALLLNHNEMSGPIPANIGFSKLSYLALANNKLTGSIPPSISHLQDSLLELLLLNNQLSGCLPHELGMLTKTTVIDAGKNQLTGPIPSSFSCLSSVEQLNLGGNRLYGQVPDALCKLAGPSGGRLANLTLSGNYFSSVGPACSALIKDGVLDVKNNCIPSLANQRAPAECASFMSQPKASCPAASAPVPCPAAAAAADANTKMAPEGTRAAAKDYASYVTYATLHE